jgi:peptidylprolyl isomerase
VRLRPIHVVAALAVPAVLAAGCGSSSGSSGQSSAAGSGGLAGVTVTPGAKPTIDIAKKPVSVAKTTTKVLTAGHGATVKKGQNVSVNYVVVDGRDGKTADSTFGRKPVTLTADPAQVLPGIAAGLVDQKIGSRVLVGVPPAQAFGAKGNSQLGVKPKDTLLFLLDIKSARTPLTKAAGTPVTPAKGLPAVQVDSSGKPTITVPKTTAPKKLVVQQLVRGKGPKVKAGQTLTTQYTGVIWSTGKKFDSSFDHGKPANFVIGAGQVIPGWDKGLVGQPVGSRVLLVVPPADGYGKNGQPQAGIKGTDTLVFVVDILDAG